MPDIFIPSVAVQGLNHLIDQETWAQELLLKHPGRVIEIHLPLGRIQLQVQEGKFVKVTRSEVSPAVSFQISQEAIWTMLTNGKSAAMKHIKISGDVDLAADINRLMSDLKWESEEDLSKLVGDATAHKVHVEAKRWIENSKSAVADLKMGVRDYLVHEKGVLLSGIPFDGMKSDIRILRDDLERLEKRVERLLQLIPEK